FGAGAFDLLIYGFTQMVLFNKTIADDLQLADMYELVRTGKWTVNAMYENMKLATLDLNGDSKQDENDQWGFNYIGNFCNYSMTSGNGAYYILKDKNDLPYLAASGNERLLQAREAVAKLMQNPSYALPYNEMAAQYNLGHPYENVVNMFADGKSLYTASGAMFLNNLRNMEDEFGILPFPKLEEYEAGTEFTSWIGDVLAYIIPTTSSETELASAVLETLAYSSYEMVVPNYLETVLQLKSTRDDDSAEMLNMLTKSSNYRTDLSHIYFLEVCGGIQGIVAGEDDKLVSNIDKYINQIEQTLSDISEIFQELD
ncbi:MAG: hypothetical protein IKV47_07220, partial [Oscillospiraceae bacterium]|nr:hypothetical protein [Oscillospiraceae bacterium]